MRGGMWAHTVYEGKSDRVHPHRAGRSLGHDRRD